MTRNLATIAFCLLIPSVAAAQDDSSSDYGAPARSYDVGPAAKLEGLVLSLGVGYGLPFGEAMKDPTSGKVLTMSDGFSGMIPVVFGIGYRVNPIFSLGVNLQYAPASTKNCTSCSASNTYVGFEIRFHAVSDQSFSPWISLGGGYEWLNVSKSGSSSDLGFRSLDFDVQVGGDFRVSPNFTLGPFLGLRIGSYSSASLGGDSGDIPDEMQSVHGWVSFGLRGAFTL